jgi:hypothetical protein
METATYVFCDWTLFDMIGRFVMFCLWGYYMGKSVTHSERTTWVLTFAGVLACALIHTWMQTGELQQHDPYSSGLHNVASEAAEGELNHYFIKIFLFYLTASTVGYQAGLQIAKKTRENLNRIQAALNRWEMKGLDEKE